MTMPSFDLGYVAMTQGVTDLMVWNMEFARFVMASLRRHGYGDWGDIEAEDKRVNEEALVHGLQVLSAYNDNRFPKRGKATIWIITEGDRSVTTVLFPDEY